MYIYKDLIKGLFGLVAFNGISTIIGFFNAKAFLLEEQ